MKKREEKSNQEVVVYLSRIAVVTLLLVGLMMLLLKTHGSGAYGSIYSYGDTVYYPGKGNIMKYSPEDGASVLIRNGKSGFLIQDNRLYYIKGRNLYTYDLDKNQSTKLYKAPAGVWNYRSFVINGLRDNIMELTLYKKYPSRAEDLYLDVSSGEIILDGKEKYENTPHKLDEFSETVKEYIFKETKGSPAYSWTSDRIYIRYPNNPNKVSSYSYRVTEDNSIVDMTLDVDTLPYSDKEDIWENNAGAIQTIGAACIMFILSICICEKNGIK